MAGHALAAAGSTSTVVAVTRSSTSGAHQPVRHAVVVAVELDVVVDVDLGASSSGATRMPLAGSGRSAGRVERLEGAAPAAGQLLEGALVQIDQQLARSPR